MENHALDPSPVPEDGAEYLQDYTFQDNPIVNVVTDFAFIYLQKNTSVVIKNRTYEISYLQKFNIYEKGAVLVWLMRARNTANTRYIYWRSPYNPGTKQIDTGTIIESTVESVGSVYEEI